MQTFKGLLVSWTASSSSSAFEFLTNYIGRSVCELRARFKALVRILQRSEEALEGGDKMTSSKMSVTGRHDSKYKALVRGPYKKREGASDDGRGASANVGGLGGGVAIVGGEQPK